MARPLVVGIGEILWDMLPGGKQLGGAPANFAYHANALGARGAVVSRVGDDDPGREILVRLRELGLGVELRELVRRQLRQVRQRRGGLQLHRLGGVVHPQPVVLAHRDQLRRLVRHAGHTLRIGCLRPPV